MGTRNRQRRAAKAKHRARQQHRRHGWSTPPREDPPSAREVIQRLVALGAMAEEPEQHELAATQLAMADAVLVDRQLEGCVLRHVAAAWDGGWQPAELVRHVRRTDGRAGRLIATAVLVDHSVRDPRTLDPRWAAQVAAIELPAIGAPTGWLASFGRREQLLRVELLIVAFVAIGTIMRAGQLRSILPPPGRASAFGQRDGAAVDDAVLGKVRALLAQAESTTFEAEAAAFTAKAQQLMARHAIDAALLWAEAQSDEQPTSIRIPIDDPYADIKSWLLHVVAEHSRTRAVWDERRALATVIGFAPDLAATELVFTSLLVQAQTGLQEAGAGAGPGARSRSRGFRSSFLLGFAARIGQRLAEVNAAVHQAVEAELDQSLLPVLASREHAVEEEVARQFAELRSSTVRGGYDRAGWARGTLAADLAELNAGDLARPA